MLFESSKRPGGLPSNLLKILSLSVLLSLIFSPAGFAQSMGQEQIEEKKELDSMKSEMKDVQSNIDKTLDAMSDLVKQMSKPPDNEIHLLVKDSRVEIIPGKFLEGMTYNGKLPGPTIRARMGAPLKVVLHNQSREQTSLLFHGLMLPQSVSGLPHKRGGAVNPGEIYAYQFIPSQTGTFWYHPQVNHLNQKTLGLYGALIVEPAEQRHGYDKDFVMMLGEAAVRGGAATKPGQSATGGAETLFTINGLTGSSIQPIEVRKGQRVRLRLVNASNHIIPISLTGHKLEIVSTNGSDALEPHIFRDTITLNPSDRVDADFTADNPGVWSLASEIPAQASNSGTFPGGIACIVRYIEYDAE
jgi:FtsP/CotA-like multicopper oxidase with cupredoxin domain